MKKILKKILFLFSSVFIVFGLQNTNTVMAAEGGYFNNQPIPNYSGTGYLTQTTDNDLNTSVNVRHGTNVPVYRFSQKENVVKYYLFGQGCINFYADANLTQRIATIQGSSGGWTDLRLENVETIYPDSCGYSYNTYIQELDFIVESQLVYEPVSNVKYESTHDVVIAAWEKHKDAKSTDVYLNDKKIANTADNTFTFSSLKSNTDYTIHFVAVYEDGFSKEIKYEVNTKNPPTFTQKDVDVVEVTKSSAKIRINIAKMDAKPDYIYFFRDGKEIGQLKINDKKDYFFSLNNLYSEEKYKIEVKAKFNTFLSDPVSIDFETPAGSKEVESLTAQTTSNQVSLTWKMPSYKSLDVARIYRQSEDAGMFARMLRSSSAYVPLFETNGTSFKDLTVSPDTQYKYKVTTVDVQGNETPGQYITARTKQVDVAGGKAEENENGDYVITWTSPTQGKIQVLVGGKEYAIVPAADKKIVIPKDKMKLDLLGNPDVMLVPLNDNGVPVGDGNKPGTPGAIGGVQLGDLGLDPKSLITVVSGLIAFIGLIMLLAMSFRLTPKLIDLLKNNFS